MRTKSVILWAIIVIIVIIIAVMLLIKPSITSSPTEQNYNQPLSTVAYACQADKTITATFYDGPNQTPADPNQPPVPSGRVDLALSDGRNISLPQAISADGAKYTSADGVTTFWSKGNGAFILENNQQTYTGCVHVADNPGNLPQAYANGSQGFSIRLPDGYVATDGYKYNQIPNAQIGGVKFTIPKDTTTGTNLSADTYISVEQNNTSSTCTALEFLPSGIGRSEGSITEDDVTYTVASSTGAGAGNRYEEIVYSIPGTNPCVAIRYFIHYGVIGNYPDTVKEFDRTALISEFDSIRKTLMLNQ